MNNSYEITCVSSEADGSGRRKALFTMTTPAIADDERDHMTKRYLSSLARLQQKMRDIEQTTINDRMVWQSLILVCLQMHQELFSLQHVGVMLMANGVQISAEHARLHELLEHFVQLVAMVPGLKRYYPLPERVEPATTIPNYRTLAQRIAQAELLFDGWVDHVEPQDVDLAIDQITMQVMPNLFREPLYLMLLAIEEPSLATQLPRGIEENTEVVSAVQLIWCALRDLVSSTLHQRWQKRQSGQ